MYTKIVEKLLILTTLLGILFPLSISAQDGMSSKLTVHEIVVGIILIVTGIIFCFFGIRIYRLTLFLIGFYIGTIITWIAFSNRGELSTNHTIALIVSIAVGIVVGLLFVCFSTVAIWFLGALAGYAFALFVLSWKSNGLIENKAGRIIFIVAFTILGLLLACFFKHTFIIIATAFIGAYAIILGIDIFVKTGFSQSIAAFMDGSHDIPYKVDIKVYLMLAGLVALFIVGSVFQSRYHKNHFGPGEGSVLPEGRKNYLPWRRNRRSVV